MTTLTIMAFITIPLLADTLLADANGHIYSRLWQEEFVDELGVHLSTESSPSSSDRVTVAGNVVLRDDEGEELEIHPDMGIQVTIIDVHTDGLEYLESRLFDQTGRYKFDDVPVGEYVVILTTRTLDFTILQPQVQINVSPSDVAEANFELLEIPPNADVMPPSPEDAPLFLAEERLLDSLYGRAAVSTDEQESFEVIRENSLLPTATSSGVPLTKNIPSNVSIPLFSKRVFLPAVPNNPLRGTSFDASGEIAAAQMTASLTKLLSSDISAGDWFGDSLDVDGNVAVMSSYWDDDNGANSGSAYIFEFDGTSWSEADKLLAVDGATGDEFGFSCGIDNGTVIVGAVRHDANGKNDAGAIYVYEEVSNSWQETKLTANDNAPGDRFGWASAIDEDTIIVGSVGDNHSGLSNPGSAYVFTRTQTTWVQQAKLTASDSLAEDLLGYSVSIDGDFAAVSTPFHLSDTGAVYIFERVAGSWTMEQKIFASDGEQGDKFGTNVKIFGNQLSVSAPYDDDAATNAGAIYVFEHNGTNWVETAKLTTSDAQSNDRLGYFVTGLTTDLVVAGSAFTDGNVNDSGAVYLFGYDGISWLQQQKIIATDTAANDWFGISIGMDSDNIFIGAERSDSVGTDSGAAYVYPLTNLLPLTVTQLSPLNSVSSATPIFEWRPEPTATEYVLAVYDETNDSVLFYNDATPYTNSICTGNDPNLDTCSVQPSLTLIAGNDYTWLVRALNNFGLGPWSTYP